MDERVLQHHLHHRPRELKREAQNERLAKIAQRADGVQATAKTRPPLYRALSQWLRARLSRAPQAEAGEAGLRKSDPMSEWV